MREGKSVVNAVTTLRFEFGVDSNAQIILRVKPDRRRNHLPFGGTHDRRQSTAVDSPSHMCAASETRQSPSTVLTAKK
jgi:hypothetical protein